MYIKSHNEKNLELLWTLATISIVVIQTAKDMRRLQNNYRHTRNKKLLQKVILEEKAFDEGLKMIELIVDQLNPQ